MKINPPLLYQSFIICMIVLFFALPSTRYLSFPYNLLGLPVFLWGASIAISTKKKFKLRGTSLSPSAKPNQLHIDGYFNLSRNPMYLGIAIGLLGLSFLMASYLNLLFPLLFVVILDRYYIPYEEDVLKNTFGIEFEDYKNKTRRWI